MPLPVSFKEITLEEVKLYIEKLNKHKATGDDGITGETLKAASDDTLKYLLVVYTGVGENESPPQHWKSGIIVKLQKEGRFT